MRKRIDFVFEKAGLIGALTSLVSVFVSMLTSEIRVFPGSFSSVLEVLLSLIVGIGITFYIAVSLYKRSMKERERSFEELRKTETEFFRNIESDTKYLLR